MERPRFISALLAFALSGSLYPVSAANENTTATLIRPPSVPLVACDPYFSIWSPADKLNGADTVHWTGRPHRITAILYLDNKEYSLMGTWPNAAFPSLPQTSLEVLPTRTIYTFQGEGVKVVLTFMTPALPDDLMVYSWPITYLEWQVQATDGKSHPALIHFDAWPEIAVNNPDQTVQYVHPKVSGLDAIGVGTVDQPVLQKKGDNLRIDWGYFYVAGPQGSRPATLPEPHTARDGYTLALQPKLGNLSSKPTSGHLILAYDDEFSIQYFKQNLRPYWRRNGDDAAALLKKANSQFESLKSRCEKFDSELMAALTKAGGRQYANLCALAYRQCCAANKVVADANGQPLMFPKENFSNGCIGTVDVIYPMAPQFLFFSPSLTKAMLVPILDYANSPRWRWPFAPHDLGTYPLANGQVYGGGERTERNQMPVEETGNMLIMLAALAQVEGNANFCSKYWPVLEKWADYLKDKGFDPENQLCTDDFAGHLAHNVNLSAKAICGLGSFAKLCEMRGEKAKAADLMRLAHEFADRWIKEADDGDHSRLAFDKSGTWSQKYNLVWDRILGLKLFADSVRRKEMDFYKTKQNTFGLPLDNRKEYTKLDWTLWTATLTQNRADFEALLNPVIRFLNETPDRVPMTDWFWTQNAKKSGFQARSVVGGVFLQMLYDQREWTKWAGRDHAKAANWAAFPKPPMMVAVVPTSEQEPLTWRYTTKAPEDRWSQPEYDASAWTEGPGGFGTSGTPGAVVRTEWNTPDIWLRREFSLPKVNGEDIHLRIHHDEDAEVYLDGLLAARAPGFVTDYENIPIRSQARTSLRPGKHVIAIHCHQTTGGQYIDAGLVAEEAAR